MPASALREFAYNIGVTKFNSLTDVAVLEHAIREELNRSALAPPGGAPAGEGRADEHSRRRRDPLHRRQQSRKGRARGTRELPLTREVYIESDDFMETPPPKYFRLRPGGEVRLKYACIIKCDEVVKDAAGNVVELRCTADLDSRTGGPNAGRKVKGTIHWVSAARAVDAEVRLYDRLFTVPEPGADAGFKESINPHSLEIVTAKLEPSLRAARPGERYQFERLGYFALDPDSRPDRPVFNRTIALRDVWAKGNPAKV